ncbi:hypothetical protein JOF41_002380 [Saccharothrix coeruleofusca]|uniref:S8 family peptidase n=1 Tax=Saccharothrix coeruleofusca TaxID=33919 RepID=UPI001AE8E234|nr:S8 family peptidase [Saccharothrix coeruleofusca]MBP2336202.1 hypothetical protein [Saccharothrix coeruleofusca]
MEIKHVLAAVLLTGAVAAPASAAQRAVLYSGHGEAVDGSYVVVLHPGQDTAAARSLVTRSGRVEHTYTSALHGFSVRATPAAARSLAADPRVAYVAQDLVVRLPDAVSAREVVVQPDPPSWGLDRIDQRSLPLDAKYHHANTAPDVRAYVVGTGIRYSHQEFGGSAVPGVDAVGGVTPPGGDCNGHGTHMAGTIGGQSTGVAKDVTLVSVRVLDCSGAGSYSQVLAGVDWLTRDSGGRPSVALMSPGGSFYRPLNDAITASINANVHYSVVSGASGANACDFSPGSTPLATTVGATDRTDAKTSWSNHGGCIDVWAPGAQITSAWGTADDVYATISGATASAHAAGAAALWRQRFPTDPATAVADALRANATPGVIGGLAPDSPNLLLFTGAVPS